MMDYRLSQAHITLESFQEYVKAERRYLVPVSVPSRSDKVILEFLAVSNALGGEAGELQNIVKKIVSSNKFYVDTDLHEKFRLEAGDVLHYLISLIDLAGYSVREIMAANVTKLEARKQEQLEAQKQAALLPAFAIKPRA